MRALIPLAAVAVALLVVLTATDLSGLAAWAVERQRGFQNDMAGAVMALRAGQPGALAALIGAAAAYGFVHAVGPGHGKYLVGGLGFGTDYPAGRLAALALLASMAQALWAILLVYGGFFVLDVSARNLTWLAEDILAPASFLAIAAIGAVLVWRGAGALLRRDDRHADHPQGCGCATHHLTAEAMRGGAVRPRRALAVIFGIAVRPCTGAVFLLVIAWQMQIPLAGAAAVLAMGLGTAALTAAVAVSSVLTRGLTLAGAGGSPVMALAAPVLQLLAGALILWFSLALLAAAL